MNGQIIRNWNEFDYQNPKHRKGLGVALQFFLTLPDKYIPARFSGEDVISKKFRKAREGFEKARMQFYTTLNDFPASPKEVIEKYHELTFYDNFYELIFDVRDFSQSRRDGFSMVTSTSGLTFKKMKTGEKLDVYQMSGDREYVYFDYYGGALNWDRKLFDNQDYWTLEDNAIEFRNKAYQIRAATFYALLEAAAATKADIAWQNPTPAALATTDRSYQAIRDANTLNFAAQTILLNCINSGYAIGPEGTSFIVLAPVQLRGRLRRALDISLDAVSASQKHIDYSFQLITSLMLSTTDHYYVILPKKKLKAGYRMDLTLFSEFDILSYADTAAGWMAFGGAVGDVNQIERCDTA